MKKRLSTILITALILTNIMPAGVYAGEAVSDALVTIDEAVFEEGDVSDDLYSAEIMNNEDDQELSDDVISPDAGEVDLLTVTELSDNETDVYLYDDIPVSVDEDAEYDGYRDIEDEEPVEDVDIYASFGHRRLRGTGSSYPAKYINRDIPALKSQLPYGTCWAFSSIALAEINLIKKGYELPDVDMSELQLAYFTYNSVTDPLGGTKGDSNSQTSSYDILDAGGNLLFSGNVLASWMGAVSESLVPYSRASEFKNNRATLDDEYAYLYDKVHLTDICTTNISLLSNNEGDYVSDSLINERIEAVKKLIYDNGAVGVSYKHDKSKYNSTYNSFYTSGAKINTSHAITLVGWDDDFDKTWFNTTAPGNGAWLIRNSHMSGEGIDSNMKYEGYFWISYYDVSLAEKAYSFIFEPVGNYDNNYQYDGAMNDASIKGSKGASVFRAHSEGVTDGELVRAAAFATNYGNVNYTIDVYTGLEDPNDPESGEKECTVRGMTLYPGYHTIPFDKKVSVESGELFSVVVSLEGGTLKREADSSKYWHTVTASAQPGQSFIYSASGWSDFGADKGSNLRIKAFTDNDISQVISFNLCGGSMDKLNETSFKTGRCEGTPTIRNVVTSYGLDIDWDKDRPYRPGYEFAGWYDEKEGGSPVDIDCPVTAELTVYAHWKLPAPVLSIQNDDQIYDKAGPVLYEDGVIELKSLTPGADIRYTLDGSDPSLSDNGQAKSYTEGIRVSDIDEALRTVIDGSSYSVTVSACALKTGFHSSDPATVTYRVIMDSALWGDVEDSTEDRERYTSADEIPEGLWIAGIEDSYAYTGAQIKPDIRVYAGKKLLKKGTDYKVSYANNKNAYTLSGDAINKKKAPRITVTLKGNYSGSLTEYFVINRAVIGTGGVNADELIVQDLLLAYNGKVQKKSTTVKYNLGTRTVTLKKGTDFTVSYPNPAPKAPGEYIITLTGKGNYTGTASFKETITEYKLIGKASVSKIKKQTYNGGAQIKPLPFIKYKGKVLKGAEKTAYEAMPDNEKAGYSYVYAYPVSGNTDIGKGYIYVEGVGGFTGKRTISFDITGRNLKNARISGFTKTFTYTGEPVVQNDTFTLMYSDNVPLKGIARSVYNGLDPASAEARKYDYTYEYSRNVSVSDKAMITLRGINGNYGTVKKKFKIKAYDIKSDPSSRITIADPGLFTYLKGGVKPKVTVSDSSLSAVLLEGRDYTLKYSNNKIINIMDTEGKWVLKKIPTITITGKGNYKGKRTVYFEIGPSYQSDKDHTVTLTANDRVWKDKAGNYTTTVTLKDKDGKVLKAGTDYDKTFRYCDDNGNRPAAGDRLPADSNLTVYVTLKGKYSGQLSASYRLVRAGIGSAKATISTQIYSGKAVCPRKDQMSIRVNGVTLTSGDYSIVSYSNNVNTGYGRVTVRGIGNYGGLKTFKYRIKVKKL